MIPSGSASSIRCSAGGEEQLALQPRAHPVLRETLGWPEAQYEEGKAELAARRIGAQFEIATAMPLGFQVHRQGATGHVQGRLAEAVALGACCA